MLTQSQDLTAPKPCQGRSGLWPLLGMLALLAGCGYTTKDLYPRNIRTVAVPILANRTFYRGVEQDLTEALIKEIELRTPYKVASSDTADTIFHGTITNVSQRTLSSAREGGLPEELEVRITVSFEWRNARTGEILRQRKDFDAVGRYIPAKGVGESFSVAQHNAVQLLAQDIVSTMRSDW